MCLRRGVKDREGERPPHAIECTNVNLIPLKANSSLFLTVIFQSLSKEKPFDATRDPVSFATNETFATIIRSLPPVLACLFVLSGVLTRVPDRATHYVPGRCHSARREGQQLWMRMVGRAMREDCLWKPK